MSMDQNENGDRRGLSLLVEGLLVAGATVACATIEFFRSRSERRKMDEARKLAESIGEENEMSTVNRLQDLTKWVSEYEAFDDVLRYGTDDLDKDDRFIIIKIRKNSFELTLRYSAVYYKKDYLDPMFSYIKDLVKECVSGTGVKPIYKYHQMTPIITSESRTIEQYREDLSPKTVWLRVYTEDDDIIKNILTDLILGKDEDSDEFVFDYIIPVGKDVEISY